MSKIMVVFLIMLQQMGNVPVAGNIVLFGNMPNSIIVAGSPTFSTSGAVTAGTVITLATSTGGCNGYIYWNTTGTSMSSGTNSTSVTITVAETVYAQVIGCPGYTNSAISNAPFTIATGCTGTCLYVTTTGTNNSTCGTSGAPCATPDYAVNSRASAGTTVSVGAGTYAYSTIVTFSTSGTSGNPIVVQCQTQWACYITSTIATGDNTQVVQINSNYLTFTGFDVTDTGGSTTNANNGLVVGGTYDTVSHNRIHDIKPVCDSNGGAGISVYVSGSTVNAVVDSNLVYNIGVSCTSPTQYQTHGINMESNGAATITNNLVYNTTGWAIQYQGTINGGVIANNTIISAYQGGLVIEPAVTNLYVVNNIILNTGSHGSSYGIDLSMNSSNSSIVVDNNLLYNNVNGDLSISGSSSAANITTANPASGTLFVNYQSNGSGNYQLISGSPAIGAGTSTDAPTTDFNGVARTIPIDIGAYKY